MEKKLINKKVFNSNMQMILILKITKFKIKYLNNNFDKISSFKKISEIINLNLNLNNKKLKSFHKKRKIFKSLLNKIKYYQKNNKLIHKMNSMISSI